MPDFFDFSEGGGVHAFFLIRDRKKLRLVLSLNFYQFLTSFVPYLSLIFLPKNHSRVPYKGKNQGIQKMQWYFKNILLHRGLTTYFSSYNWTEKNMVVKVNFTIRFCEANLHHCHTLYIIQIASVVPYFFPRNQSLSLKFSRNLTSVPYNVSLIKHKACIVKCHTLSIGK